MPEIIKRVLKIYEPHSGTLKIAGNTPPAKAAGRAVFLLQQEGINMIDFFVIGGKANQQAMKAMGLFKIFIEDESDQTVTAAFSPMHVATMAKAPGTEEFMQMDATVWRTIILNRQQSAKVLS